MIDVRAHEVDVGCGEFYSQSVIIIKSIPLMNSKILLKFNRNLGGMIIRSCACKIIEGLNILKLS